METAYHPDFGTDVNYTFEPMPDDPDGQVATAIPRVCDYLWTDKDAPIIQAKAADCIAEGGGAPHSEQTVTGVWNHIKRSMRFRQDSDIANDLQTDDPRKKDIVEVFIRPVDQALLIMLRGMGVEDCDGFTMYGACLLLACGIPCTLVTIAADPDQPQRFSHIYVAAYVNGKRIPLDFSHGAYPGWEGPHLGRIKEWPVEQSIGSQLSRALLPLAFLGLAYVGLRYARNRRMAA